MTAPTDPPAAPRPSSEADPADADLADLAETSVRVRLTVCTTCDRYDLASPRPTRGERFAAAVAAAATARGLVATIEPVDCLDGCRTPCNVALRGRGKPFVRVTGLADGDIDAVLDLALAHAVAGDAEMIVPERLRRRTVIRPGRRSPRE